VESHAPGSPRRAPVRSPRALKPSPAAAIVVAWNYCALGWC
jgi:hypothetical protein